MSLLQEVDTVVERLETGTTAELEPNLAMKV